MRFVRSLSVLLALLPVLAHGEAPVLPRGLGFRIEGRKETTEEIQEDIPYIRQGVAEGDLAADSKAKLDGLLTKAYSDMADKSAEEATVIRERLDREAGALLSAREREEVLRRTRIVFVETFALGNGVAAEEIDAKVVADFKLTEAQTEKIRGSLSRLAKRLSDDLPIAGPNNRFSVIVAARKEMRDALTQAQRVLLDERVEKAIKAAAEETKPSK